MDGTGYLRAGSFAPLIEKLRGKSRPVVFYLELTVRCNNECRHCYNNLPAGDLEAQRRELSRAEILRIAGEAVDLGAIYCIVSGGEPLLRPDFSDIYLDLKRLGLLVAVYTNACLLRPDHVELFRRYPPQRLDVTVYGVTREIYERVSRAPGSYGAFRRGLELLLEAGIPVSLKCTAMRSNMDELPQIAEFCRRHSSVPGRYSAALFLRTDGDPERNRDIAGERLSAKEVRLLARTAGKILEADSPAGAVAFPCSGGDGGLFRCRAGETSFTVDADGAFRLCTMLRAPGTSVDLRRANPGAAGQARATVADGWNDLAVRVRAIRPEDPARTSRCGACALASSCVSCPAFAFLEGGRMDGWSEYSCELTRATSPLRDGR